MEYPEAPGSRAQTERASALARWRSHSAGELLLRDYQALAETMLRRGEPLVAFDVVREGLERWPDDIRLQQLKGLAMARSGSVDEAAKILRGLNDAGHSNEETLGMLGRVYKDRAFRARSEQERTMYLERALEWYREGYRAPLRSWTGINAAAIAFLLGKPEGLELAREVLDACLKERDSSHPQDQYWLHATIAEASLILGNWELAREHYRKCQEEAGNHLADLASARRNARMILDGHKDPPVRLEDWMRMPAVAVFTGHMLDRDRRSSPRFPPELETPVRKAIKKKIEEHDIAIGYASAACGSDILFLEAILESGGAIHIVLPCQEDQFLKESVEGAQGQWVERFHRVCRSARSVTFASEQRIVAGSTSYEYAARLLYGLASIQATQLEMGLIRVTVWNKEVGPLRGGTADTAAWWRELKDGVELIDLDEILQRELPERWVARQQASALQTEPQNDLEPAVASSIMAMLFADVVKFSRLTERQIPEFIDHFIGKVGALAADWPTLKYKNTWGDGLFFVFSDPREAGLFALKLAEELCPQNANWPAFNLPPDLNLRIALHAGPIYKYRDPFTEGTNYIGTHVNRAARIEPVTPPGEIYASQGFAAMSAAAGISEFQFDYAGEVALPKNFGTLPMYHLRRGATMRPTSPKPPDPAQ